jgi:hypothetical protein
VVPHPACQADSVQTSDEFFRGNRRRFDLIFVDGLHEADQVYRDIVNALGSLNPGGTVVCHDMNPQTELEQRVPRAADRWTGDGWKAWVRVRAEWDPLHMFVVDTDHGCGIIRPGLPPTPLLTWELFQLNRAVWLNLVSTDHLLAWLR